jgi:hypothetical protein
VRREKNEERNGRREDPRDKGSQHNPNTIHGRYLRLFATGKSITKTGRFVPTPKIRLILCFHFVALPFSKNP